MNEKNTRIVFMGTPDFAVASLDKLVKGGYNIAGVVTAPDRQAGRGRKLSISPVKRYALEKGLKILQPEKLKDENFLNELKALKPDIQVVVAFRMLPEVVWSLPELGTFNLHASLLPMYRGAAPINWAVINGEKETGVTTFFIDEKIDTGKVILREKVDIGEDETAGELHDRLMVTGAELVLKTVEKIIAGDYTLIDQNEIGTSGLRPAPKIFKEDCRINWNRSVGTIYNFIRGLSPYPGAFTELVSPEGEKYFVKIFKAGKTESIEEGKPAILNTDGKSFIKISGNNGYIDIKEIQIAGKRRMKTEELLRGFYIDNEWKVSQN
jgi:methionyl-tRNA formyltransferase